MNSGTPVVRRSSYAVIAGPARELSVGILDAAWGSALLVVGSVIHLVCSCPASIARGVLFFLVAGSAAFNRDFSKLRVGPLYITELCMVVLGLTLSVLVVQKRANSLPEGKDARWILYLVIAYVVYGTLRLGVELVSGASAGMLAILRNFAVIYYAWFAMIGWLAVQRSGTRTMIRYLLASMVLASTTTSLGTVVAYAMGIEAPASDPTLDASVIIHGQAAAFAMLSILILTNLLRHPAAVDHKLPRIFLVIALLLNVVYLFMSGHRSAVLGCVAGATMMAVGSKDGLGSRTRLRWIALVITFGWVVWQLLASHLIDISQKFQTLGAPLEEINAAWRAAFWLAVLLLWRTAPLFGVGFSHDFYDEEPLHRIDAEHYDPHNSYLAILARSGAIGLLLLAAASLLFVWLMVKLVRRSKSQETVLLASCLLTCFVALATFASANVTLEFPYHALFFWLFIGLGVALADSERGHGIDWKTSDRHNSLAANSSL